MNLEAGGTTMQHILFVCTGNTCRSPLAEGMLRMMAKHAGMDVEVRSAGVAASPGAPISTNSFKLLQESGFEGKITSSSLSQTDVQWADVILTMTVSHKRAVIQRHPEAVDKTFAFKEFVEDNPSVLASVEEREKLLAELQMKQALAQMITTEERQRLMRLDHQMPDYDISDPFGGSMDTYRATAEEIRLCLDKLLAKLNRGLK